MLARVLHDVSVFSALQKFFDSIKVTRINKNLKQLTFLDFKNLYEIIEYDDNYDLIESYLRKVVKGETKHYFIDDARVGSYEGYPKHKIVQLYGSDVEEDSCLYFDGSYIDGIIKSMIESKMNESVRSFMTPKS